MGYTVTTPAGISCHYDDPEERRSCGDCLYDTDPDMCDLCLEMDIRERPLWELKE